MLVGGGGIIMGNIEEEQEEGGGDGRGKVERNGMELLSVLG